MLENATKNNCSSLVDLNPFFTDLYHEFDQYIKRLKLPSVVDTASVAVIELLSFLSDMGVESIEQIRLRDIVEFCNKELHRNGVQLTSRQTFALYLPFELFFQWIVTVNIYSSQNCSESPVFDFSLTTSHWEDILCDRS